VKNEDNITKMKKKSKKFKLDDNGFINHIILEPLYNEDIEI
jgi:hypothetical protein